MKFTLASPYDNELAHTRVKELMMQGRTLDMHLDDEPCVWISCPGATRLRYQLNTKSWQWILNYLQTGDYEDFGVFPSNSDIHDNDFPLHTLKSLIEQKCNVTRISFLRETQAQIRLIGLFNHGKLFFRVRRSDEFMDYLYENGL